MQKEKTSKLSQAVALMALLLGTAQGACAQEPAVQADASASAMDQNATLGEMIKRAKQAGEREFVAKLNPVKKNADRETTNVAPVVEKNPVLLALYGTDRNFKAELDINGQSRVVTVPGPLQKMGTWKYIALMEDGVLLTKSGQDGGLPPGNSTAGARRGATVLACQQKGTCLFLSVPKGGDDSRSLVAPDAQARLLASQLPGSRTTALEFGGKPQPPGERINAGNAGNAAAAAAAASR